MTNWSEANWSGSTLFAKAWCIRFSRTRVKSMFYLLWRPFLFEFNTQHSELQFQQTTYWNIFLTFLKKKVWLFMQLAWTKIGFDFSHKLSPLETICMKCQSWFLGKIRKKTNPYPPQPPPPPPPPPQTQTPKLEFPVFLLCDLEN